MFGFTNGWQNDVMCCRMFYSRACDMAGAFGTARLRTVR